MAKCSQKVSEKIKWSRLGHIFAKTLFLMFFWGAFCILFKISIRFSDLLDPTWALSRKTISSQKDHFLIFWIPKNHSEESKYHRSFPRTVSIYPSAMSLLNPTPMYLSPRLSLSLWALLIIFPLYSTVLYYYVFQCPLQVACLLQMRGAAGSWWPVWWACEWGRRPGDTREAATLPRVGNSRQATTLTTSWAWYF